LAADARVLDDPSPFVAVAELGESSVNLCVRPWVARSDFFATKTDLLRALKENLEAAGCTLPYPQSDVHLHEQSA
jgi:small conductance mechanosensitive channel